MTHGPMEHHLDHVLKEINYPNIKVKLRFMYETVSHTRLPLIKMYPGLNCPRKYTEY